MMTSTYTGHWRRRFLQTGVVLVLILTIIVLCVVSPWETAPRLKVVEARTVGSGMIEVGVDFETEVANFECSSGFDLVPFDSPTQNLANCLRSSSVLKGGNRFRIVDSGSALFSARFQPVPGALAETKYLVAMRYRSAGSSEKAAWISKNLASVPLLGSRLFAPWAQRLRTGTLVYSEPFTIHPSRLHSDSER
jgi:hypothetical protein